MGELGWQYGTGLKSHGTVTNWCTGREWPVNCMTVISARWRSNMLFQSRGSAYSDGQLWGDIEWVLYCYITQCTGNSMSLETRCGRESPHPVEGALGTPGQRVWRSERWRNDAVEKTALSRKLGPQASRLSSPGERERNADGHKSGGQYVAVLFGLQLPLTQPFQIKWEVYFSKRLCRSSLSLRLYCVIVMISHACIWVYNTRTSSQWD